MSKKIETKPVERICYLNYHRRAEEFHKAMETEREASGFNSACLLGIHASIALSDSLAIHTFAVRFAGENHVEAIKIIERVCDKKRIDQEGLRHLRRILSEKTSISYGEKFSSSETEILKNTYLHVGKYFNWAYSNFKDWANSLKMENQNES